MAIWKRGCGKLHHRLGLLRCPLGPEIISSEKREWKRKRSGLCWSQCKLRVVGLCSSSQSSSEGVRIVFVSGRRDDAAVTEKLRTWPGFCLCRMTGKAISEQWYLD